MLAYNVVKLVSFETHQPVEGSVLFFLNLPLSELLSLTSMLILFHSLLCVGEELRSVS